MPYQVDHLPLRACVESFIAEVLTGNSIIQQQNKKINELEADNNFLIETALEHGSHTLKCAYTEACESGRILTNNEEYICDCGWYEIRMLLTKKLGKENE